MSDRIVNRYAVPIYNIEKDTVLEKKYPISLCMCEKLKLVLSPETSIVADCFAELVDKLVFFKSSIDLGLKIDKYLNYICIEPCGNKYVVRGDQAWISKFDIIDLFRSEIDKEPMCDTYLKSIESETL